MAAGQPIQLLSQARDLYLPFLHLGQRSLTVFAPAHLPPLSPVLAACFFTAATVMLMLMLILVRMLLLMRMLLPVDTIASVAVDSCSSRRAHELA
eukprot:CAMPEP_0175164180 /NCGR_PEP_ID=MMETSP0087-20121206/26241_1 /TAXON_ID=136419 /ORGANISM="Unknown Unknown, Strain D1" /LENGTH=94 /DNA_ID=CAMNT_0016453125 /DNA_START=204 /DNA_END=484 /DNA_ORIENTATION=-